MSRLEPTLEPERPIRRVEVITGVGGRRRWPVDDKARIVEETLEAGTTVSVVARRHGLTPQQLFGWRREARQRSEEAGPQFVPAVVDVASSASAVRRQRTVPQCKAEPGAGTIEVEIDGVTVRVGRGADVKTVRAVLRALKAGA